MNPPPEKLTGVEAVKLGAVGVHVFAVMAENAELIRENAEEAY